MHQIHRSLRRLLTIRKLVIVLNFPDKEQVYEKYTHDAVRQDLHYQLDYFGGTFPLLGFYLYFSPIT